MVGPLLYVATDNVNGMKYIGITSTSIKQRNHKRDPSHFGNVMRKRSDTITFEVIPCETIELAQELEELMVDQEVVDSEQYYNRALGGKHGLHSEASKLKMSLKSKGIPKSNKHKESMRKGRSGIPWTNNQKDSFEKRRPKLPTFQHKDGRRYTPTTYASFAREFNLHAGHISSVGCGTRKSHKGWILNKEVTYRVAQ
jgi:hypothetical protein